MSIVQMPLSTSNYSKATNALGGKSSSAKIIDERLHMKLNPSSVFERNRNVNLKSSECSLDKTKTEANDTICSL